MMLVSGLQFQNHWSRYSTQKPEWCFPCYLLTGLKIQWPARLSMIWALATCLASSDSLPIAGSPTASLSPPHIHHKYCSLTQNALPTNPWLAGYLTSFRSLFRKTFHTHPIKKHPFLHPQSPSHHALSPSLAYFFGIIFTWKKCLFSNCLFPPKNTDFLSFTAILTVHWKLSNTLQALNAYLLNERMNDLFNIWAEERATANKAASELTKPRGCKA